MMRPKPEEPFLEEESSDDTPIQSYNGRQPGGEYFIRKINPDLVLPWRGRYDKEKSNLLEVWLCLNEIVWVSKNIYFIFFVLIIHKSFVHLFVTFLDNRWANILQTSLVYCQETAVGLLSFWLAPLRSQILCRNHVDTACSGVCGRSLTLTHIYINVQVWL